MRPGLAALLVAVLAGVTPVGPARAQLVSAVSAPDSTRPFEVVGRSTTAKPSHKWAWITAISGAVLVGASFPLAEEADRRYAAYLAETDVDRLDQRFYSAERMDRFASGTLLAGEGLLATAVYLRFVRGERHDRVSLHLRPHRCALAVRF